MIRFFLREHFCNLIAGQISVVIQIFHMKCLRVRRGTVVKLALLQNAVLRFIAEEGQFDTDRESNFAFIQPIEQFGNQIGQADIALNGAPAFCFGN